MNKCWRLKVHVIHGHIPGQSSERRAVCDPYPVREDGAPRPPSPPTLYTPNITHTKTDSHKQIFLKKIVLVMKL